MARTAVTVRGKLLPPFCGAEGQGATHLAPALAAWLLGGLL